MIFGANLDYSYWGEAVMTTVYLRNRSPSRSVLGKTPYEAWTGEKPSLANLKVFGCRAFAHIPDETRTKLEAKAVECVFVGYSLQSKAYRLYDPISQRIIISRDVTFFENQHYNPEDAEVVEIIGGGGEQNIPEHQEPSNDPTPPNSPVQAVQDPASDAEAEEEKVVSSRPSRNRRAPDQYWIINHQRPSAALVSSNDTGHLNSLYAMLTSAVV